MPSLVFTRQQVLEALSDEAARQEQEAIPDFIYFFLRDVFYAVDEDGDGYVTADAVRHAFPSLTSVKATPVSSPVTQVPSPSSGAGTSSIHEALPSLMTPGVRPTWCSPTYFATPHDAAHARRPLDLCGFMQTFWPLASDKMARLIGDARSQQSSGGEHDALSYGGKMDDSNCSRSSNNRCPRSSSRRTAFLTSPFRGVSMSPARTAERVSGEAIRPCLTASTLAPASTYMNTSITLEQQRLYRKTVHQLWLAAHDTPLDKGSDSSSIGSRHASPVVHHHPSPLYTPPRRLFSDDEVEQLQIAFSFLDKNNSGFVSSSEIAGALQSLLTRTAKYHSDNTTDNLCRRSRCDSDNGGVPESGVDGARSEVKSVADAMVRLALSFTTRRSTVVAAADVSKISISCFGSFPLSPSPTPANDPCLSLPVFIRSFQCDSGAFPAELIAWCVRCSACSRERPSLLPPSQQLNTLAVSLQWMSPLECALIQRTLERYAAQISACMMKEKRDAETETKETAQIGDEKNENVVGVSKAAPNAGLAQRSTVNVKGARKCVQRDAPKNPGRQVPVLCHGFPSSFFQSPSGDQCINGIAQWCQCIRSSPIDFADSFIGQEREEIGEMHSALLPLNVLETALLNDVRNALFPNAFDFSVVAGTATEAVLWNHVQAVCRLARRTALVEVRHNIYNPPSDSLHLNDNCGKNHTASKPDHREASLVLVDVARLSEVLSTDPRYLGLELLVPLTSRLEAVVNAAQRLPRRCVVRAARTLSEHVFLTYSTNANETDEPSITANNIVHLLALRHRLMSEAPLLARLITGATRFVNGTLTLHDCLAVLSSQVLAVPPPLRLQLHQPPLPIEDPGATNGHGPQRVRSQLTSTAMYARLVQDPQVLKASRGWLRYGCRRISHDERQHIIAALRRNKQAKLYETMCTVAASCTTAVTSQAQEQQTPQLSRLHEIYAMLFPHVCASCWTCRVDLVVAAHVTLALLASACIASETKMTTLADESLWWGDVIVSLGVWVDVQWTQYVTEDYERCWADKWAMSAICNTAAEVGGPACRLISTRLCQLRSESGELSHTVTVKEGALAAALTSVMASESLWAPLTSTTSFAQDACARLVETIVGCCPSGVEGKTSHIALADAAASATVVDITHLLRRWLEAFPLSLPAKYLSLSFPVGEVESIYYTLKRLAASEASKRRRSESPQSHATTFPQPGTLENDGKSALTTAVTAPPTMVVVTGITPVCLAELLENNAVLAALYAVSPPAALGVWSGSLCDLETVLRPVLLSATGVRVSLRKLGTDVTANAKEVKLKTCSDEREKQFRAGFTIAVADTTGSPLQANNSLSQDTLVAMAVPPALQHAVAQLFHLVDGDSTGAVTEDQLRSYRPYVPAAARYGWHRFVTMLCCGAIATSTMSSTGCFSANVLRSHRWRRSSVDGEKRCPGVEAEAPWESSSVATQRTDDVAATYTVGDLLVRVGELRACVQAQLLEEQKGRDNVLSSGVKPGGGTLNAAVVGVDTVDSQPVEPTIDITASPKKPTAGTAQWWAAFLEVLCQSYSALSW